MAKDDSSEKVLKIQNEILKIQKELFKMSKDRNEMSAQRSYMNNERTLSVWVRTSMSAMIFGIAIDRYGLMIAGSSEHPDTLFGHMSTSTSLIGAALILLSVVMALSAVWRFLLFLKRYKKEFSTPYNHSGWLPSVYAFMVVFFGAGMFVFMWFIG